MNAIICGGRTYSFTPADEAWLDELRAKHQFTLIIEGGCRRRDEQGTPLPTADYCAYVWAMHRGIQTATMNANWGKHGRSAGPIRNSAMAELGGICVAFPGGRGTADMCFRATLKNIPVVTRTP